eukprot:TRINITY_DN25888_c0_g1_i1.p2 TRINITY_DN25888_c0_g1~~TRINITY_DN25888_c0_g1_i1.p2  ORF type:complete len:130 (-),score=12.62 TRINITY_DN25888_c0_g1_i1:29-418(-)
MVCLGDEISPNANYKGDYVITVGTQKQSPIQPNGTRMCYGFIQLSSDYFVLGIYLILQLHRKLQRINICSVNLDKYSFMFCMFVMQMQEQQIENVEKKKKKNKNKKKKKKIKNFEKFSNSFGSALFGKD